MSYDLTLCSNPNVDRLVRFMDEHPWNYPRVMDLISGLDEQSGFKYPENNGFKEQGYDQELIDELKELLVFSLWDKAVISLSYPEAVAVRVAIVAKDAWQTFETIRAVAEAKEAAETEAVSQIMRESLLEQQTEMAARERIKQSAVERTKTLFDLMMSVYTN